MRVGAGPASVGARVLDEALADEERLQAGTLAGSPAAGGEDLVAEHTDGGVDDVGDEFVEVVTAQRAQGGGDTADAVIERVTSDRTGSGPRRDDLVGVAGQQPDELVPFPARELPQRKMDVQVGVGLQPGGVLEPAEFPIEPASLRRGVERREPLPWHLGHGL